MVFLMETTLTCLSYQIYIEDYISGTAVQQEMLFNSSHINAQQHKSKA